MRLAIFAYSRGGCWTARRAMQALDAHETICYTMERFSEPGFLPLVKSVYGEAFSKMDALVFVGACGIAVREIAPFVHDKKTDPAVLCIDERAKFVIPLLSGHIGGANVLAQRLAEALGAAAVVTTATDVNGKFAVDAWAAQNGCVIPDMALAKEFAAAILEQDLPLCSAFPIVSPLPGGVRTGQSGALGVYIGCDVRKPFERTLRLIPQKLHIGVGCRRDISAEAVETAIRRVFEENGLDLRAVCGVYSIDLKQNEQGLLEACRKNGWPAAFYSAQVLLDVPGSFTKSKFVASVTGVDNVCERAAMVGAQTLLVRKTVLDGVTVAAAMENWEVRFG